MKRNIVIALSLIIAFAVAATSASAQEKKTEQKIKIVMSDGSGETIVLDTIMTGTPGTDSIKMKNGKVVYIGHAHSDAMKHSGSGNVIVLSTADPDHKSSEGGSKSFSWVSADGTSGQNKVVVISGDETVSTTNPEKKMVFVHSGTGTAKTDSEKTRYVISRDGMVISVEGNDYDKVKMIVDEIEAKLDANKAAAAKAESSKEQKKK